MITITEVTLAVLILIPHDRSNSKNLIPAVAWYTNAKIISK